MNQLECMEIYLRVAELASFTQAAQTMGLPKASISNAVKRLEETVGTQLLNRTTRRVQMTPDGQVFYERCKDLLSDMEELRTHFQEVRAGLEGRLRVDMPMGVAHMVVLPRLPDFMRAHPRLDIELSSTDRRVDLVREGFDCVLRIGTLTDSSLIARNLGAYRLINCASPAYVAAFGVPRNLEDLAQHRLVHYMPTLGGKSPGFEYVDVMTGETRFLPMAGALTVNNSDAYMSACRAGLGIIQAPDAGMQPLIDKGELVELLPQYRAAPMPVSVLYANRRHVPRRLQVFMAWLAEEMQPYLMKA